MDVSKKERGRLVGELLELVGLAAMAARKPSQLSGGQCLAGDTPTTTIGSPFETNWRT